MFNRFLLGIAAGLFVDALTAVLAEEPDPEDWDLHPLDPVEVEQLAWRELRAIRESILAHFDYQNREQRILSDRLARRFDLGMALNEAAARAIEEKHAVVPAGYPTPHQMTALEFQAEQLTETVRRS
jgi:hypothetical protein